MQVFDKGGAKWLHIYSTGTFWLVKSDSVWIQTYYANANMRRPSGSYVQKVAIGGPFLKGNVMMIETSNYWWNDEFVDMPKKYYNAPKVTSSKLGGRVKIQMKWQARGAPELVIGFPRDKIVIQIWIDLERGAIRDYMKVAIGMQQIKGQDGHCGNFNGRSGDDFAGPLLKRIGKPVEKSMKLIPY
mmetsp:Transcript_11927/g.20784  ORF Transcript_11927/g.20784 Transcript_11927/m.20784 type:complete len:186 (-) Transcript_11927:4-561(-)